MTSTTEIKAIQVPKESLRGNLPFEELKGDAEIQMVDFLETSEPIWPKNYMIDIFGIDEQSRSYCIKVKNFKPFFLIDLEDVDWKEFRINFWGTLVKGKYRDNPMSKVVDSIKLCKGKKFRMYNKEKSNFVKITFKNIWNYFNLRAFIKNIGINFSGRNRKFKLYESNIIPLLRFIHTRKINSAGWIKIASDKFTQVPRELQISTCNFELECDWMDVEKSDKMAIGPLLTASWDIECMSSDDGFPQYARKDDPIIQIGTTVEKFGDKTWQYNYIVTLDTCDPIDNCEVVQCKTEKELIIEWVKFIRILDPDIITGYNVWGFDYQYLYERAKIWGIEDEVIQLSRIKNVVAPLKGYVTKELNSSAFGMNILKYIELYGRISIDLLKFVRDNYKYSSYKLDNVAEQLLGVGKNPVTPAMIFEYQGIDSAHRKIVAEYCIQDCKLCNRLINKLCVIENSIGMANTCHVPFEYIFMRGQGVKAYSLIVKECADLGYYVPTKEFNSEAGFKGATVLSAMNGAHFYPVSALDFASLYPSCMISHNLCISSKITKEDIDKYGMNHDEYRMVSWENDDGTEDKHYYVQPKLDSEGKIIESDRAVLPIILKKLLAQRKVAKGEKAKYKNSDPFKSSVYDGLQLAYKITANSIYGQLGAPTGKFSLPAVAASITTTGRQLLEFAQDIILKNYVNSKAVYGDTDSVFIKFELKRHCAECEYSQKNIGKRIAEFHRLKDAGVKQLYDDNEPFLHSRECQTMLVKSDYKIYKKCDCPFIEDLMGKEALSESIRMAIEADKISSSLLPYPHQLEYEKTYQPYILFSKKRYVGKLYEHDVNKWYLDYKGIVLKRRDNCGILKKVYKGCLNYIMEGDKESAFKYLKESLDDILDNHNTNKYPLEDFTLSKTLKAISSYKFPDRLPHVGLAMRVAKRDPGNAFSSNERVPYCFIQVKNEQDVKLQADKVETPTYIKKNNIKLDFVYYIKKQLQNPIQQLFEYIDHDRVKSMFKTTLIRGTNNKKGIRGIRSYFGKSTKIDHMSILIQQKRAEMKKRLFATGLVEEMPKKKKKTNVDVMKPLPQPLPQPKTICLMTFDDVSDDESEQVVVKKVTKVKKAKKVSKKKTTKRIRYSRDEVDEPDDGFVMSGCMFDLDDEPKKKRKTTKPKKVKVEVVKPKKKIKIIKKRKIIIKRKIKKKE